MALSTLATWKLSLRLTSLIDVNFIPINENLEQAGFTLIPKHIISDIIKRSSRRVILPVSL